MLIVEDEETVLRLAARVLGKQGYRVLIAHNGHEAQAVAREHQGTIDLLLTDVVMPGWNGRRTADEVSFQAGLSRPGD